MLKKYHKIQLNNTPDLLSSTLTHLPGDSGINRLFEPPYREMFQLEYLYASPHCRTYPAFMEIIKLIENFNAETIDIQSKRRSFANTTLKILCMRFMYREMLTIAVMDQNQIARSDYASKLKNWYFQLSERHSFLEGINFQKKKSEEGKLEELIRKSYISNVFDEIDDYLRKRLSFDDCIFPKQKLLSEHMSTADDSLHLIDVQLYKREQALLRNYREKQIENKYFSDIRMNKCQMREISLNNIRNRQFKNGAAFAELKNTFKITNSVHGSMGGLKNERVNKSSKSLVGHLDMSEHLDWRKSPSELQEMICEKRQRGNPNLININGINLIQSRCD